MTINRGPIVFWKAEELSPQQRALLLQHSKHLVNRGFGRRIPHKEIPRLPTSHLSEWWTRRHDPQAWAAAVRAEDQKILPGITPFKAWQAGWFHMEGNQFLPSYLMREALTFCEWLEKKTG